MLSAIIIVGSPGVGTLLNALQMAQGALQNIFDIDIARLQVGSSSWRYCWLSSINT
nr:Uncharacterised protein [Klebsiella pneumoniae]